MSLLELRGISGNLSATETYSIAHLEVQSLTLHQRTVLGILAFAVTSISALLMKDRNKAIGSSQLAFDYRLFKKVEFLLVLGWGFFSMLGYIVLLFSLPNYALSVSHILESSMFPFDRMIERFLEARCLSKSMYSLPRTDALTQ